MIGAALPSRACPSRIALSVRSSRGATAAASSPAWTARHETPPTFIPVTRTSSRFEPPVEARLAGGEARSDHEERDEPDHGADERRLADERAGGGGHRRRLVPRVCSCLRTPLVGVLNCSRRLGVVGPWFAARGWGEAVEHESDHGPLDHCFVAGGVAFVVADEAAPADKPGEGAFDDPAARQRREAALVGGLAHDLEHDPPCGAAVAIRRPA